jgi:hypothetical protein
MLDGFWLSDGYGLLVEVQGKKMSVHEISSVSCLPSWIAERQPSGDNEHEVVFMRGDGAIRLSPTASTDKLVMHEDGSISDIELRRTADRPIACAEKLADTPQNNYAVFWQSFAEQFALFPLYHTDWAAVDAKNRPRVTSATKPEELFLILREMIEPFHNAHTGIFAGSINRQYHGYRAASEFGATLQKAASRKDVAALFTEQARRTREIIESKYAEGAVRSYCNDMVHFGMLKDLIGYLRILGFNSYVKKGGFQEESRCLEGALDEMFSEPAKMRGLIIDVRLNTGGADPLGVTIASRLTRERYLAYSKVIRNNLSGKLHFTSPQPAWVEAATRPGFHGNVVLLIGPETISAGETFTMALMERKPRVSRVGENTQGVFSDVLGRKLPNGWNFGLPNEVYLTKTAKSFDGPGVAPDIPVRVFPKEDLDGGRDGALERAVALIGHH